MRVFGDNKIVNKYKKSKSYSLYDVEFLLRLQKKKIKEKKESKNYYKTQQQKQKLNKYLSKYIHTKKNKKNSRFKIINICLL